MIDINPIEYIQTVKIQGDGYLINNSISVPNDINNRHYKDIQEWLKNNTLDPEFTLDDLKQQKIAEVEKQYQELIYQDISYMSTIFQADQYSVSLLTNTLSAGAVSSGFYWLDKDNNKVSMTYSELQGLGQAILNRGQGYFDTKQSLKTQIRNITTQTDLDNIVISF